MRYYSEELYKFFCFVLFCFTAVKSSASICVKCFTVVNSSCEMTFHCNGKQRKCWYNITIHCSEAGCTFRARLLFTAGKSSVRNDV